MQSAGRQLWAFGVVLVLVVAGGGVAPPSQASTMGVKRGPDSAACSQAKAALAVAERKYEAARHVRNFSAFISAERARDKARSERNFTCQARPKLSPETTADGALVDPLAATEACLSARADLQIAEEWRYRDTAGTGSTQGDALVAHDHAIREREEAISLAKYDVEVACVTPAAVVSVPSEADDPGSYEVWELEDGYAGGLRLGHSAFSVEGRIPAFFTEPFTISITPADAQSVCSMQMGGRRDTQAPYEFVVTRQSFDVAATFYLGNVSIKTFPCSASGAKREIVLTTILPFKVDANVVNPGRRYAFIEVANQTRHPATVTLAGSSGVISQRSMNGLGAARHTSVTTVAIPTKGLKRTARFRLTIANAAGIQTTTPIIVPVGWVSLYESPPYQPCEVVTWAYSHKKARAGATPASIRRDIRGALQRISKVTSLRFEEATDVTTASVLFRWERGVTTSFWATGGQSTVGGRYVGVVSFNNRIPGNEDTWEGFAKGHTRGWMLVHEAMHVLGFGHVADKRSVMYPGGSRARLSASDIEGLRTFYPAQCPTTATTGAS